MVSDTMMKRPLEQLLENIPGYHPGNIGISIIVKWPLHKIDENTPIRK